MKATAPAPTISEVLTQSESGMAEVHYRRVYPEGYGSPTTEMFRVRRGIIETREGFGEKWRRISSLPATLSAAARLHLGKP